MMGKKKSLVEGDIANVIAYFNIGIATVLLGFITVLYHTF